MSDAEWDADDFEPPSMDKPAEAAAAAPAKVDDKWDGEDEDDDIKDNWDDEDAEGDENKVGELIFLFYINYLPQREGFAYQLDYMYDVLYNLLRLTVI